MAAAQITPTPETDTENQLNDIDESVRIARATWDTGWLQAEIYKQLLEALENRVEGPSTMGNWGFYQAVGLCRILYATQCCHQSSGCIHDHIRHASG